MKELVEIIAKSLVSNPSAVAVEEEVNGTITVLRLTWLLRIWARSLANRAALQKLSVPL